LKFDRMTGNEMDREHRPDVEIQSIEMDGGPPASDILSGHSLVRETSMTLIRLGVILVFGGVLQLAFQPIWHGRLSGQTRFRSGPSDTLEPERPAGGFGIKTNWPGLVLVALGAAILLAGAAI
jgi:hypothetical protein